MNHLLPELVFLPALGFGVLGTLLLLGFKPSERGVSSSVALVMTAHLLILTYLVLFNSGGESLHWMGGKWFEGKTLSLDFNLYLDRPSLLFLWASSFISCTVGFFSVKYLHRDPGFHRFFILYYLFVASVSLCIMASELELMAVGLELISLTSVLLIGFFQFRKAPLKGSLYALVSYRICDVFMFVGFLALHHWARAGQQGITFEGMVNFNRTDPELQFIGFLLVTGFLAKSSQFPFCSWLPRAMEGPTPSSAIFYGAISAHMGAFLLLKTAPVWNVGGIPVYVVATGLVTALYGAFVGRSRSDAKTQLAFASMAQLGLIFSEIGLGWYRLALIHMIGHSFLRTLQFLKVPSLLHEFNKMAVNGKRSFRHSIFYVEKLLSPNVQAWFYRLSILEGNLPYGMERVASHIKSLLLKIDAWEQMWIRTLGKKENVL